ncbi:MAG: protein kinase [Planctomycetota bacterium]
MTPRDRDLDPGAAPADAVEQLLDDVVALPDDEQDAALSTRCAAHPELAAALRERFAWYRRLRAAVPSPSVVHAAGAPTASSVAGARFGEFELLRELGRGGMGVVWLARQQRAGQERLVALKLVRDRGLLSPRARERLRREAAASFRLDDPGLCPVFDAGEHDGVPWLLMRYVPGRTLADHIAATPRGGALALPKPAADAPSSTRGTGAVGAAATGGRFDDVLALGEALARSLHTAHEAGFVHRDVKPGNVMVTPEGHAVLLDFGLVRDDSQEHSLTATGEALGTPAYMAPEQVEGAGAVDRTVDVYGLGATLFEAIALQPPFAGRTREQLFAAIVRGDAPDLRRAVPGAPRDLAVVLRTAMARDPHRRYATALEFALELRRVRRSEPILARPPGPLGRMRLWSLRNRLAAALLVLLALSLAAVLVVAVDARTAERRALRHLRAARGAVAELVEFQQEELDDAPWLEGVRRDLLDRALGLQRELVAASGADPVLALDAVAAGVLAANLEMALGDLDAAERRHREAAMLLAQVDQDAPRWRPTRGRLELLRGELYARRGEAAEVVATLRAAAADLLASDAPADRDVLAAMRALRLCGEELERRGDRAEALATVERALALRGQLSAAASERATLRIASALAMRASLRREANELDGAAADYDAVTGMLQGCLERRPSDRQAMAQLANVHVSHARLLRRRGRGDAQRAVLVAAQDLLEQLTRAFPNTPVHGANLALVLSTRASLLDADGDRDGARLALERSCGLLTALVRAQPERLDLRSSLAGSRYNLGNHLRRDVDAAEEQYNAALEQLDAVLRVNPDDIIARGLAARTAMNLAIGYARADDPRAVATFELARGHAEARMRLQPDDVHSARLRGQLLFNEGVHRAELGDLEGARPVLAAAAAQAAESAARLPDDPDRAAEWLRWSLRMGHVAELVDPTAGAATWLAIEADWLGLPAAVRARLEGGEFEFERAELRLAVARARARDGATDVAGELAAVRAVLEGAAATADASPNIHVELLLCLAEQAERAERTGSTAPAQSVDASASASAAAALRRLLRRWPGHGAISRVNALRIDRRLAQLEGRVADDAAALARLRALAAARR